MSGLGLACRLLFVWHAVCIGMLLVSVECARCVLHHRSPSCTAAVALALWSTRTILSLSLFSGISFMLLALSCRS